MLEVLVAFLIAALALGVMFQGTVTGLQSSRLAGHYEQALSRARSHLAALQVQPVLAPGTQTGDDGGGYTWTTAERQIAAATTPPGLPTLALLSLTVTVSWQMDGGTRAVTLHAARLATPAAP